MEPGGGATGPADRPPLAERRQRAGRRGRTAWIVGFSYADQAADTETLAADVAELLCSLSLLVGPRRAVTGAVAALGRDRVAAALPLLQPLALTSETRGGRRRRRLTSAASGVMQVVLVVAFYLAASTDEQGPVVSLPKTSTIALVILAVLVASAVLLLTKWGRRVLLRPVIDIIRKGFHTISVIARSPAKMAMLLGGAGLSKLGYIAAFDAACHAFGVKLDFGTAGAVYMTATTIGAAVPTPGGVGGIEAALVACLTAVGVDSSLAVSSMLLFRGATYWLPVIPGYIAFWYLQRVDAV